MHHDHVRTRRDEAHRSEVLYRIIRQLCIQARVDRVRARRRQQRVAVGRRIRHELRRKQAAGAGTIVDDHRLLQILAQVFREHAGEDIGAAAGRVTDDEPDGFRRIGLR